MRMMALVLVSLITLSACAVRPPAPHVTGEWQALEAWQAPPAPTAWQLDGRVSMTAADQSATVSIRWRETADGYQIDLRGALGAGRVRVTGEEGQAILATADGQRHSAGSPAELMQAVTGYDLPVEFLRWWVVGQPVPWLDGRVRVDEAGRALAMQQGGGTFGMTTTRPLMTIRCRGASRSVAMTSVCGSPCGSGMSGRDAMVLGMAGAGKDQSLSAGSGASQRRLPSIADPVSVY